MTFIADIMWALTRIAGTVLSLAGVALTLIFGVTAYLRGMERVLEYAERESE